MAAFGLSVIEQIEQEKIAKVLTRGQRSRATDVQSIALSTSKTAGRLRNQILQQQYVAPSGGSTSNNNASGVGAV